MVELPERVCDARGGAGMAHLVRFCARGLTAPLLAAIKLHYERFVFAGIDVLLSKVEVRGTPLGNVACWAPSSVNQ